MTHKEEAAKILAAGDELRRRGKPVTPDAIETLLKETAANCSTKVRTALTEVGESLNDLHKRVTAMVVNAPEKPAPATGPMYAEPLDYTKKDATTEVKPLAKPAPGGYAGPFSGKVELDSDTGLLKSGGAEYLPPSNPYAQPEEKK